MLFLTVKVPEEDEDEAERKRRKNNHEISNGFKWPSLHTPKPLQGGANGTKHLPKTHFLNTKTNEKKERGGGGGLSQDISNGFKWDFLTFP